MPTTPQAEQPQRSATISVLVENEAGVLARVIGLFSGRGYNIDSLTVAPVDDQGHRSRINIVTSGTEMVIEQIKVICAGEKRAEALRLGDAFRARVVDATTESFAFEMTGATDKLDAFIELMRPLGLAEVSRTGVAAMARGTRTI